MAGASKRALRDLEDGELDELAQGLMAERADAEEGFKEKLRAIRVERDRRATAARVADMSEAERAALREALGEG